MYICTPSVCFKQASTRPHPCASKCRRTGRCGRDRARTPARADTATWLPLVSETGPSVIQVKSSECACIFKNKIHLQKRSFSSIPPPAVGSPSQAIRVAPGLVPLRVFPVAFPKETPSTVGIRRCAKPACCNRLCVVRSAVTCALLKARWHL